MAFSIQESRVPQVSPLLLGVWDGNQEGRCSMHWGVNGTETLPQLRAFLFLSSSCWSWVAQEFFLLGGREDYEGHHPVAVANFLVIPGRESDVTLGNEFDRSGC